MSKGMVRAGSEFGKDLGVLHEMVITGRKVGADYQFYSTLAHNEDLFRRVVEIVLPVESIGSETKEAD